MEKQDILIDVYNKLLRAGIVRTKKDFAELLHYNYGNLTQAMKGNEKYLSDSLASQATALLNNYFVSNEGSVSIDHSPGSNVATGSSQIITGAHQEDLSPIQADIDMVPVIPTNIYKETDINIIEYITAPENDVPMTPAVLQFPKTTCYYTVQTMAMYPHFHQGDILALKKVSKSSPIVNGEPYAIDTKDIGIVVRFVYDRGDCFELRSPEEASHFEKFYVKKETVFNVFRIVGLIRPNI